MKMEIRITIAAAYSNGLDKEIKWYDWELFDEKGKPIAKGFPSHRDCFFSQKRSAIAAAKRMRDTIWAACASGGIPIYDMTGRGKKNFKRKLIK